MFYLNIDLHKKDVIVSYYMPKGVHVWWFYSNNIYWCLRNGGIFSQNFDKAIFSWPPVQCFASCSMIPSVQEKLLLLYWYLSYISSSSIKYLQTDIKRGHSLPYKFFNTSHSHLATPSHTQSHPVIEYPVQRVTQCHWWCISNLWYKC